MPTKPQPAPNPCAAFDRAIETIAIGLRRLEARNVQTQKETAPAATETASLEPIRKGSSLDNSKSTTSNAA